MNAAELQDKEVATVHLRPKALPIGYARRESLDIADQLRTDNGWTLATWLKKWTATQSIGF